MQDIVNVSNDLGKVLVYISDLYDIESGWLAPSIRYNDQLVMSVCLPSNFPFLQPAANSTGV